MTREPILSAPVLRNRLGHGAFDPGHGMGTCFHELVGALGVGWMDGWMAGMDVM